MKHNQSGFAHIQFIVVGVIVLSVVAFSAYRIGQVQSQNDQAKDEAADAELIEDITVKEETANEAKEVTIPTEKDVVEEQPVAEKVESTPEKKTTETVEKKKDKIWLEMTKITASQNDAVVKVVSRLPSSLSGTCHYKLWQDGYEKVYSSNKVTNATDCVGQLTIADLQTYDGWELHVWFDGSDGKTHGYQKEAPITLNDPN